MEFVNLGKIINVRGLKGELKVASFSDFSKQRYQKGHKVYLCKDEDRQEFTVVKHSVVGNVVYLTLEGIDNVDLANKYRDYYVQYPIEELPKLEEDNYYYHELLGCTVSIENKGEIGKVIAIEDNTAHPLLRVKGEKEILIPFVKYFLIDVDIANKKIVVRDVESLV